MRIYLDHCATTPLAPEVFEAMQPYFIQRFGNPSSIHGFGRETKVAVDEAREKLAHAVNALPQEIIFTSGGSEGNNTAIFGIAQTFTTPQHMVTSRVEHPSVLNTFRELEERGWQVAYVEPEAGGLITREAVARALKPDTVLISIMHANNETGTINPIAAIAALAAERKIPFHTDAVQTFGKLEIDLREIPVALMSMSAHKIYGPKGVGALFVRRGVRIAPFVHGGKQERGRRAGTENVAAIVGFAKAAELMIVEQAAEAERLQSLSEHFLASLRQKIPQTVVNSHPEFRLPGVVNVSFPGFDSMAMVMSLDLEGIAVSNGSACSSGSVEPSYVLRAMNVSPARAASAIRFSFGRNTTVAELETALKALEKILARRNRPKPARKQEALV